MQRLTCDLQNNDLVPPLHFNIFKLLTFLAPAHSLVFQHLCIFEPFPKVTDFEIHIFTLRTTEGLVEYI